jgi:hypothetical protein
MPPSLAEFKARQPVKEKHTVESKVLEQAAVEASRLVGSPEWDTFVRQLEAHRLERVQFAKDWNEKLKHALGADDVKICQINVAVGEACAALLGEIMALPKEIIQQAQHDQP